MNFQKMDFQKMDWIAAFRLLTLEALIWSYNIHAGSDIYSCAKLFH